VLPVHLSFILCLILDDYYIDKCAIDYTVHVQGEKITLTLTVVC